MRTHPTLLLLLTALACTPSGDPDDTDNPADTATDDTDGVDSDDTDGVDTEEPTDTEDTSDTGDSEDTDVTPPWSPGTYATEAQSGTRLKAHAVVDDHGNEVVAWFWDSELEVRCFPNFAADGQLRCIPEGTPVSGGLSTGSDARYGDTSCTEPVMFAPTQCGATDYAVESAASGHLVYALGTSYTNVYVNDPNRGCGGSTITPGYTAYARTEVPAASFVAFTSSHIAVTAQLGRQVLTGSDGSKTPWGLWDIAYDKPAISYFPPGSGTMYAVPMSNIINQSELVSLDCSVGSAQGYIGSARTLAPEYVAIYTPPVGPPSGPPQQSLHAITGEQTSYCSFGQTFNVPAHQKVYAIASTATDVSTFPVIVQHLDVASEVGFIHYAGADGTPITPYPAAGHLTILEGGASRYGFAFQDQDDVVFVGLGEHIVSDWFASGCTTPVVGTGWEPSTGDVVLKSKAQNCRGLYGGASRVTEAWFVSGTGPVNATAYYEASDGSCQSLGVESVWQTTAATTDPWSVLGVDL